MQSLGYFGRVIDCAMTAPSRGLEDQSQAHIAGRLRPRDRPSSAKPQSLHVPAEVPRQRPLSATLGGMSAKMGGPYAVLLKHKVAASNSGKSSGMAWVKRDVQEEEEEEDEEEDEPMVPEFDEENNSWGKVEQPPDDLSDMVEEGNVMTPPPATRSIKMPSEGIHCLQKRRSPGLGSPRRVPLRAAAVPAPTSSQKDNNDAQVATPKKGKGDATANALTTILPPATRVRACRALDAGRSSSSSSSKSTHGTGTRSRTESPCGIRAQAEPDAGDVSAITSREEMAKLLGELNRRAETADGEHRSVKGENVALRRQLREAEQTNERLMNEMARMSHLSEEAKGERHRSSAKCAGLEGQLLELSEENQRLAGRVREMTEIACMRAREHEQELSTTRAALRATSVVEDEEKEALRGACAEARRALEESDSAAEAERARLNMLLDEAHAQIAGEGDKIKAVMIASARRAAQALVGAKRRETIRQALAAWEDAVLSYPSERNLAKATTELAEDGPKKSALPASASKGMPMSASDSVASAMSTPRFVLGGSKGSSPATSSSTSSFFCDATTRSGAWSCEAVAEANFEGLGEALNGVGGMVGDVRRLDALFDSCLKGEIVNVQGLAFSPVTKAVDLDLDFKQEEVDLSDSRLCRDALEFWKVEAQRGGRRRRIVARWECRRQSNAMGAALQGWASVCWCQS